MTITRPFRDRTYSAAYRSAGPAGSVNILGLAPSDASSGWAVVQTGAGTARLFGPRYVQHGVIDYQGSRPDAPSSRLKEILGGLIDGYEPALVALCSSKFLGRAIPSGRGRSSPEAAVYALAEAAYTTVEAYRPGTLMSHLRPGFDRAAPDAGPIPQHPGPAAAAALRLKAVPRPDEAALALAAALASALASTAPPR